MLAEIGATETNRRDSFHFASPIISAHIVIYLYTRKYVVFHNIRAVNVIDMHRAYEYSMRR